MFTDRELELIETALVYLSEDDRAEGEELAETEALLAKVEGLLAERG